MSLPELTHLQFAVLSCIGTEKKGLDVRDELWRRYKIGKSGPSFYQLMERLESKKQ